MEQLNSLTNLSVCVIGLYKADFLRTLDSLDVLRQEGCKILLQYGGCEGSFENLTDSFENIHIEISRDTGVYNALNKVLKRVETKFCFIVHAGDEFIGSETEILTQVQEMERKGLDLALNSQYIGTRYHSSRLWFKWMLYFGVQPPHLPTIYRSSIFEENLYTEEYKIIGDYIWFFKLSWNSYKKFNADLIKMSVGGLSTSGLKSYLNTSKEFFRFHGKFLGTLIFFVRPIFKIIQTLK